MAARAARVESMCAAGLCHWGTCSAVWRCSLARAGASPGRMLKSIDLRRVRFRIDGLDEPACGQAHAVAQSTHSDGGIPACGADALVIGSEEMSMGLAVMMTMSPAPWRPQAPR